MATVFLTLGLVFGILFTFLTPPFQVPDEPAHFFRAYAISEGSLRIHTYGGVPAQALPASLPAFAGELTGARIRDRKQHITPAQIKASMRHRFESDRRVLAIIPAGRPGPVAFTAGGYTPLLYAPAALTIGAMRLLDAPLLVAFYLSRCVNLLISLALCYLAIRLAPFGKTILAAVGLLPMIVVLRSSLSLDSILIGLALLMFAVTLRHSSPQTHAPPRAVAAALVMSFLIAAAKPIYLLMPALALVMSYGRSGPRRSGSLYAAVLLTISLAAVVSVVWVAAPLHESSQTPPALHWNAQSMSQELRPLDEPGVDLKQQALGIVRSPLEFVTLAAQEYWNRSGELRETFVGRFGWLDTVLPATVQAVVLLFLILAGLTDGRPDLTLTLRQRVILAGVFAGTLLVTSAVLYVVWTPVGATRIEGVQGRYLIPVAPAFLLLLTNRRLALLLSPSHRAILLAMIALIALLVSAWATAARFYGFVAPPV